MTTPSISVSGWWGLPGAERLSRVGKFTVLQVLVQLLAFGGGILIVRSMNKGEYALFVLAAAVQSTVSILTDSGMSIALTSTGGRVWQDRRRLGQLIQAGLEWRQRMALGVLVFVAPFLGWLLVHQGASPGAAAVIIVAVVASVSVQLRTHLLATGLRLRSRALSLQAAEIAAATVRVALLSAFAFFMNAAVAILAALVGIVVQARLVARVAKEEIDRSGRILAEDRDAIRTLVRTQIANTIFYCLQGQIVVWLIVVFGSSEHIAEVGALGRIAVALAVITSVMTNIVVPAFARRVRRDDLLRLYWQIIVGYCCLALVLTVAALVIPRQMLWVLGPKYRHLGPELVLISAATGLSALAETMWTLNSARAWVRHSWLHIPLMLGTQAVLISVLEVSTVRGVLWFGLWSTLPPLVLNAALSARGFRAMRAGASWRTAAAPGS